MNWDEIRKQFEHINIGLKDLADKLDTKPNTPISKKDRVKGNKM